MADHTLRECGIKAVRADKLRPGDRFSTKEVVAVRPRPDKWLGGRHPSESDLWAEFDERAKARVIDAARCVEVESRPVSGGATNTRIVVASWIYEVWDDDAGEDE